MSADATNIRNCLGHALQALRPAQQQDGIFYGVVMTPEGPKYFYMVPDSGSAIFDTPEDLVKQMLPEDETEGLKAVAIFAVKTAS